MKEIKIIAIAVITTIIIMVSCAYAMPACAEEEIPLVRLTVVVGYAHVTADDWLVECEDREGNIVAFYGEEEDAQIGNIFIIVMKDIGFDLVIDEVYWEGYTEDIDDFFQIANWH